MREEEQKACHPCRQKPLALESDWKPGWKQQIRVQKPNSTMTIKSSEGTNVQHQTGRRGDHIDTDKNLKG